MFALNMSDLLVNGLMISGAGGIIAFWLKTWLTKRMDLRFKEAEERAKMAIEIEKHQTLAALERRNTIYPEILEVVYRLRNVCRDVVNIFPLSFHDWEGRFWRSEKNSDLLKSFDPALYLLTENLYKYRALVDEPVFDMLHRFKRKLQDVSVLVDRLTRPNDNLDSKQQVMDEETYLATMERIASLYSEADRLYADITKWIKATLESHLRKVLGVQLR